MNLDDWHIVFISVCFTFVLVVNTPVIMAYRPTKIEPFSTLALLGEEGKIGNYIPDDDLNVEMGESVRWTVNLYNHMGEAQYIAVRVKLLNSTMLAPNSTSLSPSSGPTVYEIRHVLMHDESWFHPIDWALQQIYAGNNTISIEKISVNGVVYQTNVRTVEGRGFRLVLELWTYDISLDEFVFGWRSHDISHGSWNQIWFNVIS